jgi:hypothetical protein
MNVHERIIEAINKLRPFKTGDDPVLCRQNDTIDRVEEIVTRVIRDHFLTDNATESGGEVDKTPTTYAEYLWRERTEDAQPLTQPEVIKGCDHLYAGLAPDVGQSNYSLEVLEFAYCPKCGEKL